jgi:tetratricopeptide (TPR) repeat protein
MKFIWIWAVIALTGIATLGLGSPRADFEAGLTAYRNNDMNGAIIAWEKILQQGEASGSLYYNLGNAYYRTGKIGLAILNYERARKLMPRDRDIYGNLDLARLATVDKIETPVRLVLWNWIDSVRDHFSLSELARTFLILGFGIALFYLLWRFGPNSGRMLFRTLMIICVICYGISGLWYGWRVSLDRQPSAIVTTTKTDIFSAPDDLSKQLFSLHEGTKVRCGEQLAGWVNIRLMDGRTGWIQRAAIDKI